MAKPPAPEQKSLVGYTVGRCKLLRICGRGAMGTVYKGIHAGLDIEVAVKILPPHLATNTNLVERFLREAKLAARLNHNNTVRVYDVGEESGYYYLIMEFVNGTDALELVKNHGPQPAWIVADIAAGAARALEHAHQNDVIHRDIKPANLMLPATGGVKVADFGLARALASESGLTMTGAVMGTPDYMAPEQAQAEAVGPSADVYSLGASMYHLFVGRPPFTAATPMAVALQHVTSRIVVPEHLAVDDPSRKLIRLIHEMTQKEISRRLCDLPVVIRRLREIALARRSTEKLLSDGATLFDSAGVKIDVDSINKAKEAAATAALLNKEFAPPPPPNPEPPPGPPSPHLDKLRRAAEKARSGMHGALPDRPVKPPTRSIPQDMAELTSDMVREAKARARRSSGQMPALPADGNSGAQGARRTSNPSVSPHRDARPASSGSSRRAAAAQPEELDDEAWQAYAAKSFPTFDRKSIIDGSATTPSGHGSSSIMDSVPTYDFATPSTTGYRRKKARYVGPLIALLLVVLAAVGALLGYQFLLKEAGERRDRPTEPRTLMPVIHRVTAFPDLGVSVNVIIPQRSGRAVYVGGSDGVVKMFALGAEEPLYAQPLGRGEITAMTMRSDGVRLVVGTSDGEVIELDAQNLAIMVNRVALLEQAAVTALLSPVSGVLIIGDSTGGLRVNTVTESIQVDDEGAPVTGLLWRNGEVWAAAGATLARYRLTDGGIEQTSRVPLKAAIQTWAQAPTAVYAVSQGKLHRMTPEGPTGSAVEVVGSFLAVTRDGGWVLATTERGLVVLEAPNLTLRATVPLQRGEIPVSAASTATDGQVIIGTHAGVLIRVDIR